MELPKEKEYLALRRDLLMNEVEEAFGDVVLGKGMSWYESIQADMSGSVPGDSLGLKGDVPWQELVEYAGWETNSRLGGGFAFMDAEGFRYYIAPALMRMLRYGWIDMTYFLTVGSPDDKPDLREYTLAKFEALDAYQRLCIKHVLEYMADLTRDEEGYEFSPDLYWDAHGFMTRADSHTDYVNALNSYWGDLEEVALPRKKTSKKAVNRQDRAGQHWRAKRPARILKASNMELPRDKEYLQGRRDALIEEVEKAFAGVILGNGQSWTGSAFEDMYGDYRHAPEPNVDGQISWRELVNNPHWQTFPGSGGFAFLDAEGFRYYLPAALVRTLFSGYDADIVSHLTLPVDVEKSRDFVLSKWADLSLEQCLCVRHVLEYMVELKVQEWNAEYGVTAGQTYVPWEAEEYVKALNSYWKDVDEDGVPFRWETKRRQRKKRSNAAPAKYMP